MDKRVYRYLGSVSGNFTATAGTIPCGNCREATMNVALTTGTAAQIAAKPVTAIAGTASIASCARVLVDNASHTFIRPAGVGGNWWIAYRVYNSAGTATPDGATTDRYAVEKLG